jgi:kumamolisin
VASAYHFPVGLDGHGQAIGLIELGGGYSESDLARYFETVGLKSPRITVVSTDGATNMPRSQPVDQVEIDIEIAGTVAPAADIIVYFATADAKGYVDAITTAVDDGVHHPSVLVTGWGSPEGSEFFKPADVQRMNRVLEDAARHNITVVAASGDHGARDDQTGKRQSVDFSASSPWVLAVGGTRLLSSGAEVAWNDGESAGASGGGVSELFERPKWQSKIRVPHGLSSRTGRGVPDVAINASTRSGYGLVTHGSFTLIGGTSIGGPMWGGLIALLNEGLGRNLGFFNPVLYGQLGPQGMLRNVIHGHNGIGELSGYCAGPGWNAVTGWGTPDGTQLLQALRSVKP